jgi:HD-GYP domain-containing protein (c-di-GMP phosphodiesterase class II)
MAIKKISVAQVRLGMFLHGFDCPWMQNPFWRAKFLLSDEADLRKALQSGIAFCWIDTTRGCDVLAAPEAAPVAPAAPPAPIGPASGAAESGADVAPTSFSEELRRAANVCNAARNATVSMFGEARLGNAIDTRQCETLVNDIAESVLRNPSALISLARLKTSDDYTYMHSVAVCALMISLGRALQLSEAACREAGLAGLLHDIGKVSIPLDILNKPGGLSDDEFVTVKSHPRRGFEMLQEGGSVSAAVLDVCLHHHEKIDGSGYPDRLAGEQISLLARMGAVCDVYDAITSNRPYKAGWDPAESVSKMISWKGHFDTKVLSAFIQVIGIYPTGALVRMRSQRLGVVVEQNREQFTKPVVKVFYCLKTKVQLTPETLDLAQAVVRDAIVAREPRGNWDAAVLDALWAAPA